ncbi:MAG: DinB family protein [Acidobacteriota bacterium]
MDYKSIDEIYAANLCFRETLGKTISVIALNEAKVRPADEKWSIEQIVEHISIVDEGMSRICGKLLAEAQKAGLKGGEVAISEVFRNYTQNGEEIKLEAPERVVPTGERGVDDSLTKLNENLAAYENLRPIFLEFDGINPKFPHPFFGPLSAQDWLVMSGEHMKRHTRQIEKILNKIRQ